MPGKNRLYPHLLPADITVWEAFLTEYGDAYDHFDYDVRVGEGRPADATYPDNIRRMATDLSQRRIDAIGHAEDHIDIIEITTSAGLKAIGQLTAYPQLYAQLYHQMKPLRPLLVCSSLQPDIQPVLEQQQIPWVIVQITSEFTTAP